MSKDINEQKPLHRDDVMFAIGLGRKVEDNFFLVAPSSSETSWRSRMGAENLSKNIEGYNSEGYQIAKPDKSLMQLAKDVANSYDVKTSVLGITKAYNAMSVIVDAHLYAFEQKPEKAKEIFSEAEKYVKENYPVYKSKAEMHVKNLPSGGKFSSMFIKKPEDNNSRTIS